MKTRQTSVFKKKQILSLSTTGTLQYYRKEEGRAEGEHPGEGWCNPTVMVFTEFG